MSVEQKIVIAMDMAGWEQGGKKLVFCKPSTGETKTFRDWKEVYEFVLKLYGK